MNEATINLKTNGFTLVEMIITVAILGILAAVAIPNLVNVKPDAHQASVDSVAGALTVASANNYGRRKANGAAGSAVSNCTDVGALMAGGLPSEYNIIAAAISSNAKVSCTVELASDPSIQATFVGIGIT